MALKRPGHITKGIEFLSWVSGLLCIAYLVAVAVGAVSAKQQSERIRTIADLSSTGRFLPASMTRELGTKSWEQDNRAYTPPEAVVLGHLEISQIGLSVPVLSDFDDSSLLKGVGHIRGTAMPGGLGTLGLAGHRDTYFRPLRNVAPNMVIKIFDQTGTYRYQIDSTEIVTPDEVRVLDIHNRPEMTLITCYPFNYVGAAPKRFIVHAHLLSVSPDIPQITIN